MLTACAREVIPADRLDGLPPNYEVEVLSDVECGAGRVQVCGRTFSIEYEGAEDQLLADLQAIGIDVSENTIDRLSVSEDGYAELVLSGVHDEGLTRLRLLLVLVASVAAVALLAVVGSRRRADPVRPTRVDQEG